MAYGGNFSDIQLPDIVIPNSVPFTECQTCVAFVNGINQTSRLFRAISLLLTDLREFQFLHYGSEHTNDGFDRDFEAIIQRCIASTGEINQQLFGWAASPNNVQHGDFHEFMNHLIATLPASIG